MKDPLFKHEVRRKWSSRHGAQVAAGSAQPGPPTVTTSGTARRSACGRRVAAGLAQQTHASPSRGGFVFGTSQVWVQVRSDAQPWETPLRSLAQPRQGQRLRPVAGGRCGPWGARLGTSGIPAPRGPWRGPREGGEGRVLVRRWACLGQGGSLRSGRPAGDPGGGAHDAAERPGSGRRKALWPERRLQGQEQTWPRRPGPAPVPCWRWLPGERQQQEGCGLGAKPGSASPSPSRSPSPPLPLAQAALGLCLLSLFLSQYLPPCLILHPVATHLHL